MPIIETIILAAMAISYVAATVYTIFLTFREIADWFASRRSISAQDRTRVAFTLQDALANGRYQTVQGVFNSAIGQVETGARKLVSRGIDSELANHHRRERLVIYP